MVYIDFDDVLSRTIESLVALLEREFDKRVAVEAVCDFDLGQAFGLSAAALSRFMARAHEAEVLMAMAPMPGAIEALRSLADAGAQIAIITGRPPSCARASRLWLERHGAPFDSLMFVDKYGRFAALEQPGEYWDLSMLARQRYVLAIEDSPTAIDFLLRHDVAPVAIFDRPWNRGYVAPAGSEDRCERIDRWAQAPALFERWSAAP